MFAILFAALVLQTAEIELDGKIASVEIASTAEARKQGLMGRTALSENSGMLFVYESPHIASLWMKNTQIPLSVGFFDEEKTLINIAEMVPLPPEASSFPCYKSAGPVLYALEMPQGWFLKNKIYPGTKFVFRELAF